MVTKKEDPYYSNTRARQEGPRPHSTSAEASETAA